MIDQLRQEIEAALEGLGIAIDKPVQLERTRDLTFGDLGSNAPMVYAKQAGAKPMELAEKIRQAMQVDTSIVLKVTAAAPGFLNFTLADPFLHNQLRAVMGQGGNYGRSHAGAGKRALVEFVSANPTGPLTVGHGRGAVLGDTVSSILAWNGYEVEREYYYNDTGRQIRMLGESVWRRTLQMLGEKVPFPEALYQGDYISQIAESLPRQEAAEIARNLAGEADDELLADRKDGQAKLEYFSGHAKEVMFAGISRTLEDGLGIKFQNFVNEMDFHGSGNGAESKIGVVLDDLRSRGLIEERDDAIWIKAAALDGEEDRVLVKSSGEPTYRLPDIAYHKDKIERKFDLIVDIFGADHSDTYPDVLAALRGLDLPIDHIRVLIHQFVSLMEGGKKVKMSTRKAAFVTLDELLEDVGADVVRYFFLSKVMDTPLKFDLELARKTSDDNPVYYLKYAHARMVNIIKRGAVAELGPDLAAADLSLLALPEERTLLHLIWWFPEVVRRAGVTLEPHHIIVALEEFAKVFHRYYTVARVVTDDTAMSTARLVLTDACRQTLANGLAILGIEAPERM